MKLILWVACGLALCGLMFWFVVRSYPPNPVLTAAMVVLFTAAPIGAFWMMYVAIRYETKPWPMVLLAMFVPFSWA